ncbi:MAG TPA: hypothetical protein VNL91_08900 [Thermoanaerobaculia bacterium]|nr:hypothetical protein [Thermoanaerobaculia bacterium]
MRRFVERGRHVCVVEECDGALLGLGEALDDLLRAFLVQPERFADEPLRFAEDFLFLRGEPASKTSLFSRSICSGEGFEAAANALSASSGVDIGIPSSSERRFKASQELLPTSCGSLEVSARVVFKFRFEAMLLRELGNCSTESGVINLCGIVADEEPAVTHVGEFRSDVELLQVGVKGLELLAADRFTRWIEDADPSRHRRVTGAGDTHERLCILHVERARDRGHRFALP